MYARVTSIRRVRRLQNCVAVTCYADHQQGTGVTGWLSRQGATWPQWKPSAAALLLAGMFVRKEALADRAVAAGGVPELVRLVLIAASVHFE